MKTKMKTKWWDDWYVEVDDGEGVRPVSGPEELSRERWRLRETVEGKTGAVDVSTVFLGLNHAHRDDTPPILYETMIFGGEFDEYQWRYTSRAAALEGHEAVKKGVQTGRLPGEATVDRGPNDSE